MTTGSQLPHLLLTHRAEILADWLREQTASGAVRPGLIREAELREQCQECLELLLRGLQASSAVDARGPELAPLRGMLERLSTSRATQGFTPSETATFVLSLKRPLFACMNRSIQDRAALGSELWAATELIDALALLTADTYLRTREQVIAQQQADMLELSTPVVKLWDGVLALPLIGTLDSVRTQTVMETLLERVVETNSEVVIIDITGVPTVDTLVAQHLLKTIAAARLMGVDCIISGIRPQIAQTIVHLGVDLGDVVTKGNLADAFRLALKRRGLGVAAPQGTARA